MKRLQKLLDNNRAWASAISANQPDFFKTLAAQQTPRYLWIGCADSRVPANQILGLEPGEIFVHRNIANVVVNTDMNCLSVLQYAVEVLKVSDVIVCGHYGCGGIQAALSNRQFGLIDNWLRNIKDVAARHHRELSGLSEQDRCSKMCELNVAAQVRNLTHTPIVQNAWSRGQELTVHGLVYGLEDGLLRNLDVNVNQTAQVEELYRLDS